MKRVSKRDGRETYPLNGDTLALDTDSCVGCGLCVEVCPHAVFSVDVDSRKASVIRRGACMECGACALNCPVRAISVSRGVGCAAAIIDRILGRKGECSCDRSGSPETSPSGRATRRCC